MRATQATEAQLMDLYGRWERGEISKNDIERRYFGDPKSHGKAITMAWRQLGIETEKTHPLVEENERLRERLRELGEEK